MRYVTMDGSRIKTVEENHTRFVSDKKEIEAVIAYIAKNSPSGRYRETAITVENRTSGSLQLEEAAGGRQL